MSGRRGFTLLESLIALAILAMVAGACLELRAGSLRRTRDLAGRQERARLAHTVFDLAIAGRLGSSQKVDPEDPNSAVAWAGERDGVAYRLVREVVTVTNPVRAAAGEEAGARYPATVAVARYTLDLGGETLVLERGL